MNYSIPRQHDNRQTSQARGPSPFSSRAGLEATSKFYFVPHSILNIDVNKSIVANVKENMAVESSIGDIG